LCITGDLYGCPAGAEKNELLFQYGINFNDLPAWQKRGAGIEELEEGMKA
jgi:tRNA(His) 5'-end guanylyltransferase